MKFDRSHPKSIGLQDFNIENCSFKGPFFAEGYSEYIPLAAIIGNNDSDLIMSFNGYKYDASNEDKKQIKFAATFHTKVSSNDKDSGIYRLDKSTARTGNKRINNLMSCYKEAIKKFLEGTPGFDLPPRSTRYQKATYDNLLRVIFGSQRKAYYFQSVKSIVAGPGFVYSYAVNDFLFCLVVPEKLIEYQKYYFILNGEFDPKGVELWVRSDFDVPKSKYKSFRSSYRKSIKIKFEEWEVPFVTKNNVAIDMIPTFNVPAALNEFDVWKERIARETLLAEREKLDFIF